MIVSELIKELEKAPPDLLVKIAFDSDIRMCVDVAKPVKSEGGLLLVVTDWDEWKYREDWS